MRTALAGPSGLLSRSSRATRPRLGAALAATATVLLLLALAPAAQASKGIVGYVGSTASGSEAGQFTTTRAIAVNEEGNGAGAGAGDFYVLDGSSTQRVQQFDASGTFVRAFGWGVQNGSNEFQICTSGCQAAVAPTPAGAAGSINFAAGITVDQATGDVVVADSNNDRIDVFGSGGEFQGAFGEGVADGSEALQFCTTTCLVGRSGAGNGQFGHIASVASDASTGNLYLADTTNSRVDEFSLAKNLAGEVTGATFLLAFGWDVVASGPDETGTGFEVCDLAANPTDVCQKGVGGSGLGQFGNGQPNSIAVSSAGVVYSSESNGTGRVQSFTPSGGSYTPAELNPAQLTGLHYQIAVGPDGHVFVTSSFAAGATTCPDGSSSKSEARVEEFDSAGVLQDTGTPAMTCAGLTSFFGLAANKETGDMYVPVNVNRTLVGVVILGTSDLPTATVDSITPTTTGAVVEATINPNGSGRTYPNPVTTSYQLEYKLSSGSEWIPFGTPRSVGAGNTGVPVRVNLGGLLGNTPYEIRFVETRPFGEPTAFGTPQAFTTLPVPPSIESFSSSAVAAHSVDLHALINPHGAETTYHFEYGTTAGYGQETAAFELGPEHDAQAVTVHVEGLEPVVYHFRVVAENAYGSVTSEDQTFNFYPQSCPNASIRQQTGAGFLPDCRAYELVSPGETGNIILVSSIVLPAPYATSPARFGYAGKFGSISGANSTNNNFDDYIATRTDTGWVTKYVGIPGSETLSDSALFGSLDYSKFIDFEGGFFGPSSPIPFAWDAEGNSLGRWPGNFASIPGATSTEGAFQPSPDFSHLAFSSNNVDFDPEGNGLTAAPGSAYDYDTATGSTTLISITEDGHPIPQEPGDSSATEFIRFPGGTAAGMPARINPSVSTDGSHILMSTRSAAAASSPTRLYMRVNDAVSYDVSKGHDVSYVGMTADGSKVFFTSAEQLTSDDHDTSTDLYMWDEATNSLTLISAGSDGAGNTDECVAGWTAKCDVEAASGDSATDNAIAAESGDVYFYSPELLDGPENGLEGAQNLYVYREGAVHFVAILDSDGDAPLTRIQVSPDGAHAAFITKSQLTPYDSAGFAEMYAYEPARGEVRCVSCNLSGDRPTADVQGSRSGLFMANDGRTFWSTTDPLVPQDTNGQPDVYEFSGGRPQLITSGAGSEGLGEGNKQTEAGLSGVSADGINVYFATFDTLVTQDHNGPFIKFYDARTDGGFASAPAPTPCVAADECHGAGNAVPPPPLMASTDPLGAGGNVVAPRNRKHRRHHAHHRRRHGRKGHGAKRRRHGKGLHAHGRRHHPGAGRGSNR